MNRRGSLDLPVWLAIVVLAIGAVTYDTACTGNKTVATMTGAFSTCAKADFGQAVTAGTQSGTLLGVVAALIALNLPELEADLVTLATTVGIDAVKCAIVAVDAVLTPAKTATPITTEPLPGLLRARAWMTTHSEATP